MRLSEGLRAVTACFSVRYRPIQTRVGPRMMATIWALKAPLFQGLMASRERPM
jgi:hypothetical protein